MSTGEGRSGRPLAGAAIACDDIRRSANIGRRRAGGLWFSPWRLRVHCSEGSLALQGKKIKSRSSRRPGADHLKAASGRHDSQNGRQSLTHSELAIRCSFPLLPPKARDLWGLGGSHNQSGAPFESQLVLVAGASGWSLQFTCKICWLLIVIGS